MMASRLTFWGGVGTVTGSKYFLQAGGKNILVDCGLFQGYKQLREQNWQPLPLAPEKIDAVVLTHAHLDHSGYLPLLVKRGFNGPVYTTTGTRDLCAVLLPDSGYLNEKDAEYATRRGFSNHTPARPLYTKADAESALERFHPGPFESEIEINDNLRLRFLPAGHILGAAIVGLTFGKKSLFFSGDLGRTASATMIDPAMVRRANYLVVESTYGNRRHADDDVEAEIADIVSRVTARGGTILIPAFAVGRAQSLLFHLQRLKASKRIPDLPVYLDSPMAIDASEIFCGHLDEHRLTEAQCRLTCSVATYVRDSEESKALAANAFPKIIIAASGMATGGRILHHLKRFGPDRRNAIIFTGFQASGTRGASIVNGAGKVKIHGADVSIRAEVLNLHTLSAHADADEIMDWLGHFTEPPTRTFVTHGEADASEALRRRIAQELGWTCRVPKMMDSVELA